MVTRASTVLVTAALAACLPVEDDPRLVDRLRVLSIRADPPEGPPGTAVRFSALAVHPSGEEPHLSWWSCDAARERLHDPGPSGDCLASGGARPLGEGATMQFTVPPAWFDGVSARDQVIGVSMRFYLVAARGSERVEAYKSFRVSLNPFSNHNPEIADATAGGAAALGAPVVAERGAELVLKAVPAEGSEEHASFTAPDGTPIELAEELLWDWFSDAGSFRGGAIGFRAGRDLGARLDAVWTAPPAPARARIWVVARDGRGGNAFETLSVEVR